MIGKLAIIVGTEWILPDPLLKWLHRRYKEELDPDYLPETNTDTEVNSEGEDFEEEVKLLVREASQDLPDNLLGNM